MPEARHRSNELDGDLSRSGQLLQINYVAFLLFSAAHVLDHKPLLGHYVGCEGQERAVGADNQRVRAFKELGALVWGSINDDGKAPLQPLAASLPHPLSCLS